MEIMTIGLIIVSAILIFYLVGIYNHLVTRKHNVSKAWSNIDVLLKQRHDEIPKLVDTCRQFMEFEQSTLEKVMLARSQVAQAQKNQDIPGLGLAEGSLRLGMGQLFALSEAYPELQANDSFRQLQSRISQLENNIADRREFYNETANLNNIAIEQFPDLIIARSFNFTSRDLLEFAAYEISDVKVASLFAKKSGELA